MFQNLTERLSATLKSVTRKSKLTEDNIRETLREVRKALLEADVALSVVKEFINEVRKKAIGTAVKRSLNPGQMFLKIVKNELVKIMGEKNEELNLSCQPPAVILMAGLQGAGKTTTVAKLGYWLQHNKKKVSVVSTDIYRPAAIKQLETLALETELNFFPSSNTQKPLDIAKNAIKDATLKHFDVVIIDTAGRLHIDEKMMDEIKLLHTSINPIETLFVIDAMTGQDAVNTAKAFNETLEITGTILTKADGDARGGAALSVSKITQKPIKFIGVSEKKEGLEPFRPDRIASRILGMGDMLSLIEEAERNLDKTKADKLIKKIKKGKSFSLDDLKDQLQQMKKLGGLAGLIDKLPGAGGLGNMAKNISQSKADSSMFNQMEAIISSMTKQERQNAELVNTSRKKRIAAGSGTDIQDVNKLLKHHKQMRKMMKKMGGKSMSKMARGFQSMNMKTPGTSPDMLSGIKQK